MGLSTAFVAVPRSGRTGRLQRTADRVSRVGWTVLIWDVCEHALIVRDGRHWAHREGLPIFLSPGPHFRQGRDRVASAEAEVIGEGPDLAATRDAELPQHGGHVMVGRLLRDVQTIRQLGVGQALCHQPSHFELTVGQSGGVGPGTGPRSNRQTGDAASAQLEAAPVGGGRCAETVECCDCGSLPVEVVAVEVSERGFERSADLSPLLRRLGRIARERRSERILDRVDRTDMAARSR